MGFVYHDLSKEMGDAENKETKSKAGWWEDHEWGEPLKCTRSICDTEDLGQEETQSFQKYMSRAQNSFGTVLEKKDKA